MRVLIACEESQTVCKAFRERGHEAYSCDIIDCSGGHPEWHIKDDVLNHLEDGWDLMIAENQYRLSEGKTIAYTEKDFIKLRDEHGIHHNGILTNINGH